MKRKMRVLSDVASIFGFYLGFAVTSECPVIASDTALGKSCMISRTIRAEPPLDPKASPFGIGDWYVNSDRSIWVRHLEWEAGRRTKVLWIRPPEARWSCQGGGLTQMHRRWNGISHVAIQLDSRLECCDSPPKDVGA